jgi:UDP-GlcNAc:undecaprenyl-phosphate GlcNAc-1-phosphate transferase
MLAARPAHGPAATGPSAITAAVSFPESLRALFGDAVVVGGFVLAFAVVLATTPLVRRLAPRIGAVDNFGDRPRIHRGAVPRIGGVAIVAGILVAAAVLIRPTGAYLGILIGTALVAVLGLVDDVRGLRPSAKMLGVLLIGLIPVVGFDVTWDRIGLPLVGSHELGLLSVPLTLVWIAALANLVNLIDGMDALAAGIVAIAAGTSALLAASFHRPTAAALAAIVCGATVAFLRHNYHPATIFMGDSGALALGFVLALVAVEGVLKTAATIALAAPLLVMAVPILDTSFVVLKRLKYRRPPWDPDHNHFYHRFLRIGFSQRRTAAYLHAWAALLAGYAILLRFVPPRPRGEWDLENTLIGVAAGLLALAASVWMIYTLEILKARHLEALGLRRPQPPETPAAKAVERAVTAGRGRS